MLDQTSQSRAIDRKLEWLMIKSRWLLRPGCVQHASSQAVNKREAKVYSVGLIQNKIAMTKADHGLAFAQIAHQECA